MKIIHVLADGSVKEDLTGHRLNPDTAGEFYNVLSKICRSRSSEKGTKLESARGKKVC